uniref:Fringe-like glycosyltransferase domain-containing protein n=1 Tax=Quercus lobata TaxID=97700 RepID=A0A7N2KKT1_QUELO
METFRQGDKDVRWYVMADDDTVLMVDSLVEVLAKYDHTKSYYVGSNSESVKSNFDFSFDMAFGGAGYDLSYPLAEALSTKLDGCLLSAHPQTPFLSLHHIDTIDPIFPSMDRSESINRLMKAVKIDQFCLLQQIICYHRQSNWSLSISWGYSAYIYENIIPRSI